ncbi:hypothetical protein Ddc_10419 [Ditylenchus destructor]|nr:hypothetical protein Ddc_10419 [Ditylenchus destructor]
MLVYICCDEPPDHRSVDSSRSGEFAGVPRFEEDTQHFMLLSSAGAHRIGSNRPAALSLGFFSFSEGLATSLSLLSPPTAAINIHLWLQHTPAGCRFAVPS